MLRLYCIVLQILGQGYIMLVVTRKPGEKLIIGDNEVQVKVIRRHYNTVTVSVVQIKPLKIKNNK